ncbi:hypothetical protein UG55_103180 [Frankia sp. EI5c]|uniref:hypothetical protein n=1 Tax=Frankia sp. EI5c TaxID=683316 RepID=UPI0007C2D20E|nr:hypothetical protein [Frankia sp. EI5c]OAA24233.1 hypothetical protein UG55_103180 [Frankia sp. EI5c]
MDDRSGGLRLAAEIGTGTSGALVVFALILASAGLFVFLSKSLRRMRMNVASGEFGAAHGVKASRGASPDAPVGGAGAVRSTAGAAGAAEQGGPGTEAGGKLPRQRAGKKTEQDAGPDPA